MTNKSNFELCQNEWQIERSGTITLEAISIAGEGDGELARSQFVFDAILPSIHRNQVNEEESKLAIVRLMSTHAKIKKILGSELKEGRWYGLQLRKSENEPLVWIFEERAGSLLTPARTNLLELVDYGSLPDTAEMTAVRTFCTSSAVRSSTIQVGGSFLSSHQDAFIRVETLHPPAAKAAVSPLIQDR